MSYADNETWLDRLLRKLRRKRIIKHIPDKAVLADIECRHADIVTMLAMLKLVTPPQELLNEAFRMLKQNGIIRNTTPTTRVKPILEFLPSKCVIINRIKKTQLQTRLLET